VRSALCRYALISRPQSADEWTLQLRLGFLNGFTTLLQLLAYMQVSRDCVDLVPECCLPKVSRAELQ